MVYYSAECHENQYFLKATVSGVPKYFFNNQGKIKVTVSTHIWVWAKLSWKWIGTTSGARHKLVQSPSKSIDQEHL